MVAITAILVVAILVFLFIWTRSDGFFREIENKLLGSFIFSVVLAILAVPITKVAGGFLPDYSEGIREGYITKISKRGYIWKTWEGQLQIGTGEMAAIQQPYEFSVTDEELLEKIQKNIGKRIVMEYREWAVMPFYVGESGYQATKVDLK